MVGIVGFEPTTFRLEGECSIQLSYIPKYWLGRLDSNQSMQESKSCALPAWLHPNEKLVPTTGIEPVTC